MTTPMLVLHNTIRCTKSVAFILMLSLTTHTYDLWVRVVPIAEVRPTAVLLLSGKKKKVYSNQSLSVLTANTTTKLGYGSVGKR